MRVYRYITLQEVIDKYRNTETYCFFNHTSNTHNYDEGKKYIHFFRYYEFAKYYEREEYDKYIQVVNDFIQSNQKMDYIVDVLMQINFEKLLGIHIDTRTEEEMKKDVDLLLSTIHMPINNDDEIEEIGGMNDEMFQKRQNRQICYF